MVSAVANAINGAGPAGRSRKKKTEPSVRVMPALVDADGQPRELPEDTCLIPWPEFILACYRRRPGWAIITALVAYADYRYVFGFLEARGSGHALLIAIWVGIAVFVLLARKMDNSLTRPATVARTDVTGGAWLDFQRWWSDDALDWEDSLKLWLAKDRILFLDALEPPVKTMVDDGKGNTETVYSPGPVRFLWVWGSSLPDPLKDPHNPDWTPTMSYVGSARTTARSYGGLHIFETEKAQLISKLFVFGAIALSLVFTYMAAGRGMDMLASAVRTGG